MWTYCQSTGVLTDRNGNTVATGYSGHPPSVNMPGDQFIHNQGPIPQGSYSIGPSFTHPLAGPVTMRLTPLPPTDTQGRDGFMMHGDLPPGPDGNSTYMASEGCVIMPRSARTAVSLSADRILIVVP